jgi:hypothetical protein
MTGQFDFAALYASGGQPTIRDDRPLPMVRLGLPCDRGGRKGQHRGDTLIANTGLKKTMPDPQHLIAQCLLGASLA